jgi:hypothetical protein
MAKVYYRKTELRSKNQAADKPRRRLGRTRITVNKKPVDLKKLAARRMLKARK